ncbi:MAG: DNA/RNA non-specific endonuclease [candidate division WOR-3 bacterium]
MASRIGITVLVLGVIGLATWYFTSHPQAQSGVCSGSLLEITDSLAPFGLPRGHETEGKLLVKKAYECYHSPRLKVSLWVAYRAEGEDPYGFERYRGKFFAEPSLQPGQRAEPQDYKGLWRKDKTGLDRGHQAPDATIRRFGLDAQRETYSLANITPQHSVINQGIWQDLEAAIRTWSSPRSPVWVITGPVFYATQETTWVGPNRVAVPHAYYLILARGQRPDVQAFLIANGVQAPFYTSFDQFRVSVDSIERLTNFDFLWRLPDSLEDRIEARTTAEPWH